MNFSYGSVCSGIEAASVAWHSLGWRPAWFAEIEPNPAAILAHRWPDVPNLGDMTLLARYVRAGYIEAPDVLVGGTPCQAFSVAGLRGGLTDARGQLTLTYVDLANAIDEKRGAGNECVIYWENVPGVLSDATNAFGCLLGALAGEDGPLVNAGGKWPNTGVVVGPQRAIAWRVLDAQYFGVAQRRRRVFVVASARDGFDPAAILLELDGLRRDSPPRRETGEEAPAGTLRSTGGGCDVDHARAGHVQAVVGALTCGTGEACNDTVASSQLVTCMAHGQSGAEISVGRSPTLTCNHEAPIAVYSVALRGREGGATAELGDDLAGCLRASGGGGDKPHVLTFSAHAQPDEMRFDPHVTAALTCSQQQQAVCVTGDITHTLKAEGFDASEGGTGRGQPIVAMLNPLRISCDCGVSFSGGIATPCPGCGEIRGGSVTYPPSRGGSVTAFSCEDYGNDAAVGIAPTMRAMGHGATHANGGGQLAAQYGMAVRRLTPRECERLQGFPDDYTLVPMDRRKALREGERRGEPRMMADGPRYKALGNSMAVPCMRWLGVRLMLTHPDYFY